ncbi:ABC transporter permease [Rhodohalobacter sp. SW132]|uniref:cell division protein FtsX n=1 Tax=Rhodohalobacter sp. SW132 TaxID=2293433 RepID=UPI000E26ED80|nr:permease-like cell division protein FtsX [Rhodohalobacter sp. SW132]REL29075.1 ABC transporter permease [Rhodohalobacter sp. SW132]
MSLSYLIKEGVAGLSRARLAAFTSIFSLFLAVLLIGVLTRIGFNAYEVAQLLRQQVEIEVFLQNIDTQTTNELQQSIQNEPFVEELNYISRDSASMIFQQEFGMGGEALASLNFLPASFRLKISDDATVAQVDSLVQVVEQYHGVDEVQFNLALLELLEARTDQLAIGGAAIGMFILFIAMILVFNTIRLTIYAKRDLIRAMKLVGATNGFIRRPFLVEGILQGIIAGTAASFVIYLLFEWIVPTYLSQLGILTWPFGRWYYLIGGVMILAMAMGWWGSRWAARKFIKDTTISS